jgi:integrase
MPRKKAGSLPAYRPHVSGQAVVTVRLVTGGRRDIYLGPHGSIESKEEYERVLSVLRTNGGVYPLDGTTSGGSGRPSGQFDKTVNELLVAWVHEAERERGADNKELRQYKYSIRPLRELYGTTLVADFDSRRFKLVRQRMVDLGWCRSLINRRMSRIRAMFSWGVGEKIVPAMIAAELREVKGLRAGTYGVKESQPVQAAFWGDVVKVLPHCSRPVGAMLQLQFLAGMRSGEVRVIRTMDIDQADPECWLYRPGSDAGPHGKHKNAWRGQDRVIPLSAQCIAIVRPWLRPDDPTACLFRPKQASEEQNAKRRSERKSKRQPSQLARKRKRNPKRAPGEVYTDTGYPRAVARACERAGVSFSPYDLRHGAKMVLEREFGSDAARCVLGQKSIDATVHYGQQDLGHAVDVMKRRG